MTNYGTMEGTIRTMVRTMVENYGRTMGQAQGDYGDYRQQWETTMVEDNNGTGTN